MYSTLRTQRIKRSKNKQEIAEELKEIFNPNNPNNTIEIAWQRWLSFIERHKKKYPTLKKMLTERYRLYFTYYQYDYRIRNMIIHNQLDRAIK